MTGWKWSLSEEPWAWIHRAQQGVAKACRFSLWATSDQLLGVSWLIVVTRSRGFLNCLCIKRTHTHTPSVCLPQQNTLAMQKHSLF